MALILALAGLTNGIDTIVTKGPAVVKLIVSLSIPITVAVILYYASALILTAYREWQESKRLYRKRRLEEIREIRKQVVLVGTILTTYFSQDKEGPIPAEVIYEPVDELIRILVRSVVYKKREELFGVAVRLRTNDFSNWDYRIKPVLDHLAKWDRYAEQELKKDLAFQDPLAIPYVPPDPFGLNKPKE